MKYVSYFTVPIKINIHIFVKEKKQNAVCLLHDHVLPDNRRNCCHPSTDQYQIKLSLNQNNGIYRKGDTVQLAIGYQVNGKTADGMQITVIQSDRRGIK